MRGFSLLILAVVAVLLARYARSVDWPAVGSALVAYRPDRLAAAAALGALSYLLYCGYDLAARTYTGHELSTGRVLAIAFVSYAFNLNLGALVGGGGLRYRLYTRSGIRGGIIAHVIAFSIVTNWLGYLLLAGGVFVLGLLVLPDDFSIGSTSPRILGALMLATAGGYLLACAFVRSRTLKLRGREFTLPSLSLAVLQLVLSTANWLTIAAILFILLGQRIDYPLLLGVVLLGAVAAAMTHIPAGLGALEAVFIVLLGSRIAQADLLAALLAYRALYYLAPLLLAIVVYIAFESRVHRHGERTHRAMADVEGSRNR
jgi:uncharacterized membrane protein YbhN (UPF0104 family)